MQVEGTVVLAAVTIAVGQSVAASGDCVVQVNDSSISSCSTTTSPFELQSFLQRLLDENLEFEQLSIATTNASWALRLQVQVQILDADGACYDVAVAAVSAALLDTSIPVQFDPAKRTVSRETQPLHLPRVPCTLSAVIWSPPSSTEGYHPTDHTIVDPTSTEEEAGERLLSLVTVDALQPDSLLAIQGPVRLPLLDYASGHARKLYNILQPQQQAKA